jgi:ligand-binding sensor domain-containing protein
LTAQAKKWVGTDYGLASYNDTTWTFYNTLNSGLTDNVIRSIAVDIYNNKWIGTFFGGLFKFDGDTTWTSYNLSNSNIPDDFVKSIAFDTSGNIWIGTTYGLAKFDGDTTWTIYDLSNSVFTITDNIADINIDTANVFRIGTVNGGYLRIVDTVWTLYTIPNGSGIPDNTQLGVTVDNNGLDWMATPANGLVAHPGGMTWNIYNQFTTSNQMPTSSTTCLIAKPNPDRIWVGTYDFGVVRKTGLSFAYFDSTNSPVPDVYIQCIEKDPDGIIWIGTQIGGLVKLDESQLTDVHEVSTVSLPIIFPIPVQKSAHGFLPYSKIISAAMMDVTGKYVTIAFNESAAIFTKPMFILLLPEFIFFS